MNLSAPTIRAATVGLLLLGLGGCTTFQLVEPGSHDMGTSYQVTARHDWNAWVPTGKSTQVEVWTLDGTALQQVRFHHGIEPGDALTLTSVGEDADVPRYEAGMRANDVVRTYAGTLEFYGHKNVEVESLAPARFGDWSGFRFRLTFTNADGLAYQGLGTGAIDANDRLHLVVYLAADEHYFEAQRDDVERIFASIDTLYLSEVSDGESAPDTQRTPKTECEKTMERYGFSPDWCIDSGAGSHREKVRGDPNASDASDEEFYVRVIVGL